MIPRPADRPWLHRFALLTALATFVLIGIGGLVTSKEAGMAVPDWPTSYGYNMFLLPISKWVGGIFFEHVHRLAASVVGMLTVALAVMIWRTDDRRWMRWLGAAAVLGVVLQGVLGGLRVVLLKDQIGIFHAALAQMFLVTVCAIALFTSKFWRALPAAGTAASDDAGVRRILLFCTVLIFGQLLLGATMRHQHAGLAIPDFPLAYHKVWPPTDAASLATYNQNRLGVVEYKPITAFQIVLQMIHRLMALVILTAVAFCAWSCRRRLGGRHFLAKLSLAWLGLILTQALLGAITIWSNKAADIATAHVVVGALSLVTGSLLTILSARVSIPVRAAALAKTGARSEPFVTVGPVVSSAK